jgi:hypothetical protein
MSSSAIAVYEKIPSMPRIHSKGNVYNNNYIY